MRVTVRKVIAACKIRSLYLSNSAVRVVGAVNDSVCCVGPGRWQINHEHQRTIEIGPSPSQLRRASEHA